MMSFQTITSDTGFWMMSGIYSDITINKLANGFYVTGLYHDGRRQYSKGQFKTKAAAIKWAESQDQPETK